jgi:hypothetical protein
MCASSKARSRGVNRGRRDSIARRTESYRTESPALESPCRARPARRDDLHELRLRQPLHHPIDGESPNGCKRGVARLVAERVHGNASLGEDRGVAARALSIEETGHRDRSN